MYLKISYPEISEIVKTKTGKDISMSFVDNKTISVSYKAKLNVPLLGEISKVFDVKFAIMDIDNEDLHLSYDAGSTTDMVASIILNFIPQASDNSFMELQKNAKAILHFEKIDKIHEILNSIEVKDILFEEDKVCVEFSLKI